MFPVLPTLAEATKNLLEKQNLVNMGTWLSVVKPYFNLLFPEVDIKDVKQIQLTKNMTTRDFHNIPTTVWIVTNINKRFINLSQFVIESEDPAKTYVEHKYKVELQAKSARLKKLKTDIDKKIKVCDTLSKEIDELNNVILSYGVPLTVDRTMQD